MNDCTVTLSGNLTRDPELKFTNSGQAVTSGSVAVNRRWRDAAGEWQDRVSFFNWTAWGELGENLSQSCSKGDRVVLTGRFEQREYETRDGEKRTVYDLVVDDGGPSLRWATCEVERTHRSGGSEPSRERTPARSGAGRGDSYPPEEPF